MSTENKYIEEPKEHLLSLINDLLYGARHLLDWVITYEEDCRKYGDFDEDETLDDAEALRIALDRIDNLNG